MRPPILAILGPTATGKSALGIELASRRGGEVISCDSTAVYRGFDIGTDKVPVAERRGIPHHLIDIVEPTDEYTAVESQLMTSPPCLNASSMPSALFPAAVGPRMARIGGRKADAGIAIFSIGNWQLRIR